MFLEANRLYLSEQQKPPIQWENKLTGHMKTINKLNKFHTFQLPSLGQVATTPGWIIIMPEISLNREECRAYLKTIFSWTLDFHVLEFSKTYKDIPKQIYGTLFLCNYLLLRISSSMKFYFFFFKIIVNR